MEIQITAIKFETVNGKKTGKSFAFKLDPKKMAAYKTEATLRKKIEEYVAKSGVFKNEELKDLKYSMKDFLEEWRKQIPIVEAEELAKLEVSPNNPESRVTPDHITRNTFSTQRSVCLWFQRAGTSLWRSSQSSRGKLRGHHGTGKRPAGNELCHSLYERTWRDGRICQGVLWVCQGSSGEAIPCHRDWMWHRWLFYRWSRTTVRMLRRNGEYHPSRLLLGYFELIICIIKLSS